MAKSWISNNWCLYDKPHEDTQTHWGLCRVKTGRDQSEEPTSQGAKDRPDVKTGKEGFSPIAVRGNMALLTPIFQSGGLQNRKKTNFYFFKQGRW